MAVEKWEDPVPLLGRRRQAYLGRSRHGEAPIIIHKMSPDGRELLDDGFTVYTGPVAEGTKIYKRDGYYYISIPEGGVEVGWQTVLRSRNIYGPYEKKVVMEQGSTPHQRPAPGSVGRHARRGVVVLPFPVCAAHRPCGTFAAGALERRLARHRVDIDMNGHRRAGAVWTKPRVASAGSDITLPQSSDDFAAPVSACSGNTTTTRAPSVCRLPPARGGCASPLCRATA